MMCLIRRREPTPEQQVVIDLTHDIADWMMNHPCPAAVDDRGIHTWGAQDGPDRSVCTKCGVRFSPELEARVLELEK